MREVVNAERIVLALVLVVFALILTLLGFILWFSLPLFFSGDLAVFSLLWRPEAGHYGIVPMVVGSAMIGIGALVLALPVALGIVGFCLHERHQSAAVWIRSLIRLMAGIPTVVYGLAALFLLVPLLRETFRSGSGYCLLAAMVMVVLLILPVMVMMLDSHCRPLAARLKLTGTALGFSETQQVFYLILPNAQRGFFSAALLGFSRAIGDTLLPLMLAGNAPQLTGSLLDSVRALTAHIGLVIATEYGSDAYNSLFAAGLLLLSLSISTTLLLRKIERRQSDKR
ncbi:ABC transporter permease [Vibrio sp. HA2012]|uniref:PstC family ABC transporter permease n=1 Tax=Vibrio sp. HA2012 TaxID=1971595 RepID=UPI000C2C8361|nr:ABC transporter permease subunit [Vibrio sp. HA2012]PJC87226.1 ABC transporter permease [Vibrio sp. HA2012]